MIIKTILSWFLIICVTITDFAPLLSAQALSGYEWVVESRFVDARMFSEGLASVALSDLEDISRKYSIAKAGYINPEGEWVLEHSYNNPSSFVEGLAWVRIKDRWGLIDKKGQWIIEPQFEWASPFQEGIACVQINRKHGYIRLTNE